MDKSIGKNELERGAFIGDENFGVVYQGKWNGHEVAIKKLHIRHLPEYLATEYNNHFKALGHPNIIITHGICEEPRKHAIVMELMQTSLKRWIEESNKMGTPISSKVKNNIGFQAGKGLSFLHSKQIPHRHLKSSNVLLRFLPGGGIEVKLTDMGLSQLRVEASQMGRKKATVRWRAPETFIREYARTKDQIEVLKPADVYALGMLLWEMNAMKIPYAELSEEKVLGKICVGERETIPETCILGHKAIIERCWSLVPKERPSAQAVQNAIQNTDQLVEKGMLLSSLLGLKDVNQQVKTFLIESIVKDFFPAK